MAYYDFLNVVMAPLFKLPALAAIILLALLISLVVILVTKFTTDQALMKRLKEEMKEHQKKAKELRSEPAKAIEIQKKMMEANMKYMSHSLRPTLITFIPIILIFGWMNANFAFESIKPQQEFSVSAFFDKGVSGNAELSVFDKIQIIDGKAKKIENNSATWRLKGSEGEHLLEISQDSEKQQTSVMITSGRKYINAVKQTQGRIRIIKINYNKLTVLPIGYKDWLGWLGTYIWSSIIFTTILRKVMKVY